MEASAVATLVVAGSYCLAKKNKQEVRAREYDHKKGANFQRRGDWGRSAGCLGCSHQRAAGLEQGGHAADRRPRPVRRTSA